MITRRLVVVPIAAVAATLLVPAGSASADGPLAVVCTGITTTTYDPPLTDEPQSIKRTTQTELLCVPLVGLPFTGSRFHQITSVQACPPTGDLTLPGQDTGPGLIYEFDWDNNDPPNGSTVESNGFVTTRPLGERITVREGEVIGGRYNDYRFYQEAEGLQVNPLACQGEGIAQTIGDDLLEFTVI